MSAKPVSPLNIERYELKYRIPMSMVEPISQYVSQYCEMDYYSQISPNGFYVINSLYLDTPSLYIFRRQETAEFDYSTFRIRSYGSDPKPPFYLESKQKIRDFCKKRRGKVPIDNLSDIFERPWSLEGFDPYKDKNVVDFMEKVQTFGLEPFTLTQYKRRAFLSTVDEYARVTFDIDMKCYEEKNWNVRPSEALMSNYDSPEVFDDYESDRRVILELKCERKIPIWMIHLIRQFEVVHDRYSKFRSAMLELYGGSTARMATDLIARSGEHTHFSHNRTKLIPGLEMHVERQQSAF